MLYIKLLVAVKNTTMIFCKYLFSTNISITNIPFLFCVQISRGNDSNVYHWLMRPISYQLLHPGLTDTKQYTTLNIDLEPRERH
jgi:hypothetical protein